MDTLKDLGKLPLFLYRIKGADEAKKIFIRHEELIHRINEFKKKYFNDWAKKIPKVIEEKTNKMILARQGSDLILNFNPTVGLQPKN